jgi:hypothetical protein
MTVDKNENDSRTNGGRSKFSDERWQTSFCRLCNKQGYRREMVRALLQRQWTNALLLWSSRGSIRRTDEHSRSGQLEALKIVSAIKKTLDSSGMRLSSHGITMLFRPLIRRFFNSKVAWWTCDARSIANTWRVLYVRSPFSALLVENQPPTDYHRRHNDVPHRDKREQPVPVLDDLPELETTFYNFTRTTAPAYKWVRRLSWSPVCRLWGLWSFCTFLESSVLK